MMRRLSTLLTMALLITMPGLAKSKDKALPTYILEARTVVVVIDPGAGIDLENPRANQVAQADVEAALGNWGRFRPVIGNAPPEADLIIVIRKGNGRLVNSTINDPRQADRAGAINNQGGMGAQNGRPPVQGGPPYGSDFPQGRPLEHQTEIGGTDDSFVVFDGRAEKPLDGSPGWRYVARDGLRPHGVPAVDEFRKAVAEAERAAAAKKP
jgi:hypothetical protein